MVQSVPGVTEKIKYPASSDIELTCSVLRSHVSVVHARALSSSSLRNEYIPRPRSIVLSLKPEIGEESDR